MAKRRKTQALARRSAALQKIEQEPGILGTFQRMAQDPRLTVDKLEKLIDLNERILDREAAATFEAAFELMQPEIPRITKRGKILNKEQRVQSKYARYEDIRKVTDPILLKFGFTVHYSTRWPAAGLLQVVGELRHRGGGKRISEFQTTADASGGKNAIQGLGSGVSYGKRYVLKDLLGIVEEGVDDDGEAHGKTAPARQDKRQATPKPAEGVRAGGAGPVITEAQRRRLVTIVENSGRGTEEVSAYLQRLGFASSKVLTQDRYDEVCRAIEGLGAL